MSMFSKNGRCCCLCSKKISYEQDFKKPKVRQLEETFKPNFDEKLILIKQINKEKKEIKRLNPRHENQNTTTPRHVI